MWHKRIALVESCGSLQQMILSVIQPLEALPTCLAISSWALLDVCSTLSLNCSKVSLASSLTAAHSASAFRNADSLSLYDSKQREE